MGSSRHVFGAGFSYWLGVVLVFVMRVSRHEVLWFSGFLFHEFACLVKRHSVLGELGFTLCHVKGWACFRFSFFLCMKSLLLQMKRKEIGCSCKFTRHVFFFLLMHGFFNYFYFFLFYYLSYVNAYIFLVIFLVFRHAYLS